MNYSDIYMESVRKTGFYEIVEKLTSEQKTELIKSLNYRNFRYHKEQHCLKTLNIIMAILCGGCVFLSFYS